ncbi:MAG: bifunctional DNA primase/polymerase [Solirubrobacterales bacterium]|nr:bifunctional DNA primase/polymerase [Solirubrobacterales bacterium]
MTVTAPTMLEHALHELALGAYVFPLRPRSKIPFGAHDCPSGHPHEHGHKDATSDPDVVRAWWRAHPDANNGVALEPSGQVLLDYDFRADLTASAEDELFAALGPLPETRTVLSRPDGSRHRVFRANGVLYTSAPTLIPGIEIKHKGGYRVGAGSIHPDTGAPYLDDEVTADLPLAPCPDFSPILPQLREVDDKPALEEQVGVGGRHHALTRVAGALRRLGLSGEEMVPTLLSVNAAPCVPPVGEQTSARSRAVSRSATRPRKRCHHRCAAVRRPRNARRRVPPPRCHGCAATSSRRPVTTRTSSTCRCSAWAATSRCAGRTSSPACRGSARPS